MNRTRKKAAAPRAVPKPPAPAKVAGILKPAGIKPGRNATINDIARLASVSKKTVSRVINQSPLVQEATRARIQAVIDKFGYVPDPQARGLAFRKAFLIGLVYDNPNAQYIVNCMEGALDAVRNSEYEVVVHPCDRKKPDFISGVRRFVERQKLRGVILMPPISENDELTRALTAADCAYVRISYTQLDEPARMVISNDRLAVAEVANYLVSLGHKRIGYIAGPSGFRSAVERLAGFRDALASRQIAFPNELIVEGGYTYESGVADSADPLGGSHLVEAWTEEIASKAHALIERIDSLGGAVAAIEGGFFAREIEEAAYSAQRELEEDRRYVVGVNVFRESKEASPPLLTVDPAIETDQIERLRAFRASREPAACSASLEKLRSDAREDRNLMPAILRAVESRASLGEIISALKTVWGEYRPGA